MKDQPLFLKGVIEGFYGRSWSFDTRRAYASFLAQLGLNTYIYCPKEDPNLRKQWSAAWPLSTRRELKKLSELCRAQSVLFGIGLSPFALYENYGPAQRMLLRQKIEELNGLDAPLLAILFDDMPGDIKQLASRQGEIVNDILQWTHSSRVMVCPTYYSFDPVLPSYFGDMPSGYWSQLGSVLPEEIEILWTGDRVCSESVSVRDIEAARAELGHPILLWDNYPVNDGAIRSKFLYGDKLYGREAGLEKVLSGHLCNPMNQGLVSLRALMGLAELYTDGPVDDEWLCRTWGQPLYNQLMSDLVEFQTLGLEGMGSERCRLLATIYSKIPGAAAREVVGWLQDEYRFDPACLTD